jgi:hypothetical protein
VQLVGSDISLHLIDVGYCGARYANAVAFVSALKTRLQRYLGKPDIARAARAEFRKRVAWWRMALSRTSELCRWSAIVLMNISSVADK